MWKYSILIFSFAKRLFKIVLQRCLKSWFSSNFVGSLLSWFNFEFCGLIFIYYYYYFWVNCFNSFEFDLVSLQDPWLSLFLNPRLWIKLIGDYEWWNWFSSCKIYYYMVILSELWLYIVILMMKSWRRFGSYWQDLYDYEFSTSIMMAYSWWWCSIEVWLFE